MNASTKRIAAIASIALVVVSGCASFDANVAWDGDNDGYAQSTHGPDDILRKMHVDSQAGGE
jgi:hypothetical protein